MAKKTQEEIEAMTDTTPPDTWPVATESADPPPTIPPSVPDPWAIMSQLVAAIESLKSQPDSSSKAIEVLTSAVTRMSESNIEGAKLITEESRKAHRPSNQVIPNVSVFNRRGTMLPDYQKPALKCLMMLPWLAEAESMTREEVELLNLLEAGEYTVRRADRSKIVMTVQIRYKADNITPSALIISHETAHNNDNFRNMPPLADMVRDILKQHDREVAMKAASILTDEEEEALIEAGELSVSA